ncbi:MAG: ABC transporter permease [Deltaproteobacteria bacterium]|nr:ABC transporter permease [Deltaproteobacteria bacterium]
MAKQEDLALGTGGVATPDADPSQGPRKTSSVFSEAGWDVALRVGSIFALIIAWWAMGLFFPPALIPRPWETFGEVGVIIKTGEFYHHMGNTLWRVFVGFGLAMVVSTPLGIIMGSFRNQESFFEPPVILGLTMPGLIWALLMLMVFGIKEISAYLAVAVTISPMLTISIWQGTKSIDKDLIDMSTAFRASVYSKLVDVILPQLVSHILAAIRYGLGLAWKVIVLVEGFGFSNGVGYQVMHQFDLFSVKGVLAWAITFLIVMIFLEFGVVGVLERSVTRWRPRVEAWRR